MMSEDPGERWYQLIQADGDLTMIVRSLQARADALRAEAKGHKWTGQQFAHIRKMLRDEADQCIAIAQRAGQMAQSDHESARTEIDA